MNEGTERVVGWCVVKSERGVSVCGKILNSLYKVSFPLA